MNLTALRWEKKGPVKGVPQLITRICGCLPAQTRSAWHKVQSCYQPVCGSTKSFKKNLTLDDILISLNSTYAVDPSSLKKVKLFSFLYTRKSA